MVYLPEVFKGTTEMQKEGIFVGKHVGHPAILRPGNVLRCTGRAPVRLLDIKWKISKETGGRKVEGGWVSHGCHCEKPLQHAPNISKDMRMHSATLGGRKMVSNSIISWFS